MESEVFLVELETLAFFNHNITFPFLDCIENSSQGELLIILPQLYNDLQNKKTDTLKDFIVNIHGVSIPQPTSDLAKKIIDMMCEAAAEGIKLQCGREYGFSESGEVPRATVLSSLSTNELEGLPSNNLSAERNLSIFDKRASKVTKSKNFKFTAKSIRNDMQLYKGKQNLVDPLSRKVTKMLEEREKNWNAAQKIKFKERIELKLKAAIKVKGYSKKLLKDCKTWGGPCTSSEELFNVIKTQPEYIVKTEMAYFSHTHKSEKIQCPSLFRLNGISHEEKLENLVVLLTNDNLESKCTLANLPTTNDALKALTSTTPQQVIKNTVNDLCVTMWQDAKGRYSWYIGYIKNESNDKYTVDHLECSIPGSNKLWKYPEAEDIQVVEKEQILNIVVEGDWNLVDSRNTKFTLNNEKTVSSAFKKCNMK